jgi:ABC-type branched-subunit amino acid transport system permease subunit
MIGALGVDIGALYTLVFALGAALAGLAGAMVGALQSVQVGMGEPVLILAFVVIVIGGIGSIKGALIGALLVGVVDTMGVSCCPRRFAGDGPGAGGADRRGARLDADLHRHGADPRLPPARPVRGERDDRLMRHDRATTSSV